MIRSCCLTLFTVLNLICVPSSAAEAKPNIVYILADDMGYHDVGFNGSTDFHTPHLDRLAKNGTVLKAMYGQPVCSPSRATLLTGRYPTRTGVYRTVGDQKSFNWPLPLNEQTLADSLRAAGYTTAICGKWHLGEDPAYLPLRRGFDHQYGHRTGSINSSRCTASLARKSETGIGMTSPARTRVMTRILLPRKPAVLLRSSRRTSRCFYTSRPMPCIRRGWRRRKIWPRMPISRAGSRIWQA